MLNQIWKSDTKMQCVGQYPCYTYAIAHIPNDTRLRGWRTTQKSWPRRDKLLSSYMCVESDWSFFRAIIRTRVFASRFAGSLISNGDHETYKRSSWSPKPATCERPWRDPLHCYVGMDTFMRIKQRTSAPWTWSEVIWYDAMFEKLLRLLSRHWHANKKKHSLEQRRRI